MVERRLVGRHHELGRFASVLDAAQERRGGCVAVTGDAGMGKTSLCEALGRLAADRGLAVAWTACWDTTTTAFAPWSDLLVQVDGEPLAVETASTIDPVVARTELFAHVVGRLRDASDRRPLLLVVDDLHWADAPTALLVAHLLPVLRVLPVALLVTYREDEMRAHPAEGIAGHLRRHAEVLALPALVADEIGALVAAVRGTPVDADLAARLHDLTGGNPLFARELANLTTDAALAAGDLTRLRLPESLLDVLSTRLRRQSERCLAVLEAVAGLGELASPALVAATLEQHLDDVVDALGEAARNGLLRDVAPTPTLAHPLLRAAVLDRLPASQRSRLHARIGQALVDAHAGGLDVPAAALAHHLLEAAVGDREAEAAVAWAERAADEAMAALAYEFAGSLRSRALAVLDGHPDAGDRARLLVGLGTARAATGRGDLADDAFHQAVALARRQGRPEVVAQAVLGITGGDGFEVPIGRPEHVDMLREARRLLGGGDPSLDARLAARLSVSSTLVAPVAERRRLAGEALTAARQMGDPTLTALALASHCDAIAGPAHVEERGTSAREMVDLAVQSRDVAAELLARRLLLVALLERGQIAAVDREIDQYAAAAGRLGQAAYAFYVPLWRGMRALMRGDVPTHRRHRARLVELVEESGSENARLLLMTQDVMAAIQLGGDPAAVEAVRDAIETDPTVPAIPQIHVSLALVALATGDQRRAGDVLDRWEGEVRDAEQDSEWLPMVVQAADVLSVVGADRLGLVEWVHGALVPHADRYVVEGIGAYVVGSVARPAGRMAALLGRSDEARALLEQAATAEEAIGAPALAERTRRQAAELPSASRRTPADRSPADLGPASEGGVFRRDGDHWLLEYAGSAVHVSDSLGMHDLAALLARPGIGVAALDLATATGSPRSREPAVPTGTPGDLGDVLDRQARQAYRSRIEELEAGLEEADRLDDLERSARLGEERDLLLAQLAGAYGLGGRPRRAGDPAERARTAVTGRIRYAIRRIRRLHPALAAHLDNAVRTGAVCSYAPERETRWAT